jgi:hypothetical protein
MVTDMFDESDPELTRAFAQAREPLAEAPFIANLRRRIERARRIRLWGRILAIAAVVLIASLNMRRMLEGAAAAVRFAGDLSATTMAWLVTPGGWAVSLLIGIWIVLRTRPARR